MHNRKHIPKTGTLKAVQIRLPVIKQWLTAKQNTRNETSEVYQVDRKINNRQNIRVGKILKAIEVLETIQKHEL